MQLAITPVKWAWNEICGCLQSVYTASQAIYGQERPCFKGFLVVL